MKKLVLLTGATGGIGQAIAKQLAKEGYRLLLQGRNRQKLLALQATVGDEHEVIVADLCDEQSRTDMLDMLNRRGDLSIVINNAGISSFTRFEQESAENINWLMAINLIIPMQICQSLLSQIKQNKGAIINIGSAFGYIGFPCFSSYCASKFGLRGFSESLSRELANTDVSIGYFAPRTTATDINSAQTMAMNEAMGNAIDSPEVVAQKFSVFLKKRTKRQVIGWPEKLFARINGLLPSVVDMALAGKLNTVLQFVSSAPSGMSTTWNKDSAKPSHNPPVKSATQSLNGPINRPNNTSYEKNL